MDFVTITFVVICLAILLSLWRLDCDLNLFLRSKFGKTPETLKGKVIWITGASSGIGKCLALELAKFGCRLVLSARRDNELQSVKNMCLSFGKLAENDILVVKLDMLDFDSHSKAVEEVIKYFNKIDILVNNAGRSQLGMAAKTSLQVDREALELNILSVLSLTKQVLPHMQARKSGHVVVTSSVAGKIGAPTSAAYSASKFALHGWFDTLRVEEFENNIHVTLVCPGPVVSAGHRQAFTDKPGEFFGHDIQPDDKKMKTERCAELMAITIANQMYEVWISQNPILLFTYMAQYMPTITRTVFTLVGGKIAEKFRGRS